MRNTQKLILINNTMSFTDKNVLFNANLKEILNDYIEQINSGNGTRILGNPTLAIRC